MCDRAHAHRRGCSQPPPAPAGAAMGVGAASANKAPN